MILFCDIRQQQQQQQDAAPSEPCDYEGELREHFAQFGHIRKCIIPFDKETGFHRGMGWIQFSSEEELQNALQQENHIIDGVKLHIQAQRPKILQGDQTSDEEKDF
ncbi:SRA stem-loop-interacting RNA-binding protein, mitochondrial isoform X2 [Acinonyx jubatus]|uniref:SRA stem-loop-interacting RNA-binding protein, mitochondrial isoform X2 n=1 Tax=Acinonyx jubatus TaxID=32536 RepID=A0A6I9ZN79_ACIJB|nr:SRA stem-loop-interacting RNA-binding protein, mitochondrial isoform X2 [Acinonyx jubatus]